MNDNNGRMLDLCFEIEGLLALMLKRENDVPEKVKYLLNQKIAELSSLSGACGNSTVIENNEAIAASTELEEKEDAEGSCEALDKTADKEPAIDIEPEIPEDIPVDSVIDDAIENGELQSEYNDNSGNSLTPIALTLNDKFRFRRELFGNNAAELSDALDVVNAVSSQTELDDYFYNDLCWDPENPDVKDFMALASARFNK